MTTNKLILTGTMALGLCFASCKSNHNHTQKATVNVTHSNTAANVTVNDAVANIKNTQPDYRWLVGKSHAEVSAANNKLGFSANFRIRKDSVVWIQCLKFGFEVARAALTQDSITALDRFNKQYFNDRIATVSQKFGVPVSYSDAEAVLAGFIPGMNDYNWSFLSADNHFALQGVAGNRMITLWTDETWKIKKARLIQGAQQVTILYDDYQAITDGKYIAWHRSAEINSPQTGTMKIDIDLSDIQINTAQPTTISIPAEYKRMAY